MPPLRLLLADDHRLFRQGLRRVCEAAGLTVVAEAEITDGFTIAAYTRARLKGLI